MPITPEDRARQNIDSLLTDAGRIGQDKRAVNLSAGRGVAVREFPLKSGHGEADYLLFLDGAPIGVVEAKREGVTLTGVELKRADLDDFVACFNPTNRHERKESERFRPFAYEDLLKRDKVSLNIFWLKDESLEDSANLPDPDVIAAEIAEDLQAALDQFAQIASDLKR